MLLFLCLLLGVALSVSVMSSRGRPATVTFRLLTPEGPQSLQVPGPDSSTAYQRLLLDAAAVGPLETQWRRVRHFGALRDAQHLALAGNSAAARRALEELLRHDPAHLLAAWHHLEVLVAQRDHSAARDAASGLLLAAPGFGPALLRRARAREALADRLGSMTDLRGALERPLSEQDFAEAAAALLQQLVDLGHPAAARRLAVRLGTTLPASATTTAALGQAAHALGDHAAAVEHFREALAHGEEPDLLIALGHSLAELQQYQEALELLLGQRFTGTAEGERRRLLSRVAAKLQLNDLALASAEEALVILPDAELRLELAQHLLDRSSDAATAERALLVIEEGAQPACTGWAPAEGLRCLQLAVTALRRSGRHEEAAALLRRAIRESPTASLLGQLSLSLLAIKQPLPAAHLLAALGTASDSPLAAGQLQGQAAEAYAAAGHAALALTLLDAIPARLRPARASAIERVAAQQAEDWQRLRRLLETGPRADDGLPQEDAAARAYCHTLARLAAPELRDCIEALARRYGSDASLQYHAADLARQEGALESAATWLERALALEEQPQWLLERGFLLHQLGRSRAAEQTFRRAEAAGAGAQASLALGYLLLQRGRKGPAAHLLRHALQRPDLASEDRKLALETLGDLLEAVGAYEASVPAYREALALGTEPILSLRLATVQMKVGDAIAAEAALAEIEVDDLDLQARARYLDLRAELAQRRGDRHQQVEARRAALSLAATSERHELLASALLKRGAAGDKEEAREHLARAIALGGMENPRLLARLAYLDGAAGDLHRAEYLLLEAMLRAPTTLEYREDLAQLLADTGREREAITHFRAALDAAEQHPRAQTPARRRKVAQLQAQHADLSRRWRFRLEETFCLGRDSACRRTSVTAAESQVGQGLAEVGFQPLMHQPWGRLELTARLNWDRAPRRVMPRGRYTQAAAGLRVQPLRSHDLWVGLERTQALGTGGRSDWRLFGAYRRAQGLEWHHGDRELRPFTSLYGELSRYLGGDQETTAVVDATGGLRGQWGDAFAYQPFLYLTVAREQAQHLRLSRVEAGLGLSGSWRVLPDRYDGYLGDATLSLRIGQERDSLGKSGTRGVLSYGLRY